MEKADEISLVMLFNKVQTKEDIERLREIPPQKLSEILQNTPSQVLQVIADVLYVLLLKENVPAEEAEELVEKVKEKKMAELFENMEKIDIQAERRKTAKQKVRADKAEERAEQAEERAEQAEEKAFKEREHGIKAYIELCKECQLSKTVVLCKLMEKYALDSAKAEEYLKRY